MHKSQMFVTFLDDEEYEEENTSFDWQVYSLQKRILFCLS